ncbi:MAG: M1 family metallopeptidase [Bacteroidetes bacterium]|nr:M1 family metallopeptidase [Bacteroidota bacterium]
MKKTLFALLFILFTSILAHSQTDYFQQEIVYKINVRLDDNLHFLHANEEFTYTNRSQDTLDTLFIHLWPNAYKDETSAFARQKLEDGDLKFHDAASEDRGFIDSLNFTVDGKPATWSNWQGNPDIAQLALPSPLLPGGKIVVATPFRVKIPISFSRLGHVGQQYQLCQWYPKPAVYDLEGWHPMPYLDQGEFYSEFGTFDVKITLPRNYVVGATGDLPENDPEIEWLQERERKSHEMFDLPVAEAVWKPEFAPDDLKTLHFHQERVHDFAWFCDKNYYVLADTVNLPVSRRPVRCVAMFTNLDRNLWERGPEYVAKAVFHYSKWNGDYPYNHATAVDGALSAGAGMEYPNITVLGAGGSASNLEMVTMHEVGHNWYYGILGSNERAHPWMDEGLNTFFESRYWKELHNDKMNLIPQGLQDRLGFNFTHTFMNQEGYRLSAAQNVDQPVEGHSAEYTSTNYGVIVYMKSGLSFNYLEDYLGREKIDKCFHTYYERWKFKHPQPEDIQAVFEEVSGEDLDWFFDAYLNGKHKVDFKITKQNENTFTISNKSGTALPASLSLLDDQGKVISTYWTKPFLKDTTVTVTEQDFTAAKVNANGEIPELKEFNNSYRKGLFPHRRPFALDFLYKFPSPDKFHLGLAPVIGYNTTDGFMGGLLLYHNLFPERPFSFHVMPMFGFGNSHVVGSTGFTYRWLPSKVFRKIELQGKMSSYSTFLRIRPSLTFHMNKALERSPFTSSLSLQAQILARRFDDGPLAPDDWYLPVYGAAKWNTQAHTVLSDFELAAELGGNIAEPVGRASIEGSYARRILKKMRGSVRVFGGFAMAPNGTPYLLQYRVSGSSDPFGENILFDRAQSTSWLSHQITRDHGGFSSLTGRSFDQGLLSVNGNLRLPGKFLSIFGDFAVGTSRFFVVGEPNAYYDLGLRISILKESLQFNFPIAGTVFGGLPSSGKVWWQGVNFSIDPLKSIRGLGRGLISF